MNKVILMGRLTKDPEVRYTQTNKQVTTFTLAVNRPYDKDNADFINIITWNKVAEFTSKYFSKGRQVAIVGRLSTRTYDDKNGKKVYVTEVVADECYFADSRKTNENENLDNFDNITTNYSDDDLPF